MFFFMVESPSFEFGLNLCWKIFLNNKFELNGFKKFAMYVINDMSFIHILAKSHITIPAGAATATALANINIVLSNIDLIITFNT